MTVKLTYEFVKEQFEKEGYTLLSEKYINSRSKLNYVCPFKHKGSIRWSSFQSGSRCPLCSYETKRTSYNFIKEQFEKEGYELLTKEYINSHTNLIVKCDKGHIYSPVWTSFRLGHRCPFCNGNKKLTYQFIKEQFEKEGYTLISKEYINSGTKLDYICDKGHQTTITYGSYSSGTRCGQCYKENNKKENHPSWRGGVTELKLPLFDTYAPQINWIEEVRRDPTNNDFLQVRCSETNCRKWFTPTRQQVHNRITALGSDTSAEIRFYCSEECKHNCSIFNKRLYPSTFKPDYSREVQPELREMVLERDNFECQRCEAQDNLECHHIESIWYNPIESADIDNCIIFCKDCHIFVHSQDGCRYVDLTREKLCN